MVDICPQIIKIFIDFVWKMFKATWHSKNGSIDFHWNIYYQYEMFWAMPIQQKYSKIKTENQFISAHNSQVAIKENAEEQILCNLPSL